MKKGGFSLSEITRRVTLIDVIVGISIAGAIIFFLVFFLKKDSWIRIEVKARSYPTTSGGQRDGAPYFWLSKTIKVGDAALDGVGRKIATVEKINRWGDLLTETWLTINIKAHKDKSNIIRFNYQNVAIGSPIKLQLGQSSVEGVVTYIEGVPDNRTQETKIVKTRLIDWSDKNRETFGAFPWVASSIREGDTMVTSDGETVAKIISVDIRDADRIITTANGGLVIQKDPWKKDIFLTISIKTTKIDQGYYYLDDYPVKINAEIPFVTSIYYITPRIMEMP